jgi:hypothetical protein
MRNFIQGRNRIHPESTFRIYAVSHQHSAVSKPIQIIFFCLLTAESFIEKFLFYEMALANDIHFCFFE